MTEKTIIANVTATKARRAVRKLRHFGMLAYYDKENRALVGYVTKYGEQSTRNHMAAALESFTD